MSTELAVVLALLMAAIVMFVINKPRMDIVALLMMTLLPFTGVITMPEALAGFSDSNIVLIAALFVIGEGLVRTGVAQLLGDWLQARAGKSETKLLVLLMLIVCGLGATMSSTAVTAIFIPVVLRIARKTRTAPSRLMMPLSFAALISGMTTLIATAPNLVVNSELVRHGIDGFSFFDFTPFGAVILVLGIVYMLFARRWLSSHDPTAAESKARPRLADWVAKYRLSDRGFRLRVTPESSLSGKTLRELHLRSTAGANIVSIERQQGFSKQMIRPTESTELQVGDTLLVDLQMSGVDIDKLRERYELEQVPLTGLYFNDRAQAIGMAEAIVTPDSDLVGKTLVEAEFRSRYGLNVIGLRRGSEAMEQPILSESLHVGDTLLVIGAWKEIDRLQLDHHNLMVLNLPQEHDEVLPVVGKAPHAVLVLLLVIGLMISGLIPIVQAALLGCLLMGVLGCVDVQSAYQSINWKTIVLIVGMLPFSTALDRTGGVEMAAEGILSLLGESGTYVILGALFAITAILGMFISNTATAVLMAPIAIAVAQDTGNSPYPFAMIVALAASTAFMTPVSSPVNTLVVGPGNYKFGDFLRVGVPFSIIVLIASVLLVPWLLPLRP
ncbi:SLC13 family permease [Aeoliella sp. SH292]|uniref:SLC13 family permease n=1 Tax=Aeoliella sp. SH292 TaxID=3454464 RepID=UPI003F9C9974